MFKGFDYVVAPSVSCTAFIRLQYPHIMKESGHECHIARKTMDMVEFLHDVLKVDRTLGRFPTRSVYIIPAMAQENSICRHLPRRWSRDSTK